MQSNTKVNNRPTGARAVWLVTPQFTLGGTGDHRYPTPPEAFSRGIGGILEQFAALRGNDPSAEMTILVDGAAAAALKLTVTADPHPASLSAEKAGYDHTSIGTWTTFFAKDKPDISVGQLDRIRRQAAGDPDSWPFGWGSPAEMVGGLQRWQELTGIAWQAGPAVMGIELLHRHLPSFRIPGVKGLMRPAKKDPTGTPEGARESVWTPAQWRRPTADVVAELGLGNQRKKIWLHEYDKVRAGMTAAGVAKLSPAKLQRTGPLKFTGARAGWWQISAPPWSDPRLPHPAGPDARLWERLWVTTATMDLLHELAEMGRIDMPDVIDSYTGPARQVLAEWQNLLAKVYDDVPANRYGARDHRLVQLAVKESATRGIGMIGNPDATYSRPDQFHAVNATKRANGWRTIDEIGRTEDRYPVAVDDDGIWYASDNPDPITAAPKLFNSPRADGTPRKLNSDAPGNYRHQATREVRA